MDNPLKNIFSNIKIFNGSGDRAVGVDIGSSAIKVVEIKKKAGRVILETYGSVSLGPYADVEPGHSTSLSPEKIIEALKEVLKQAKTTTKEVAVAIPAQTSLIFNVDLPPQVKETEIASIIPTEARKYIPVPITEVSLNWFLVPQKEPSFEELNNPEIPIVNNKKEVLVVAIQNDTIAKYRSIISGSDLSSSFFEAEVFSSIRSNFEHELSLVLLMDFGASQTKLSLVEFGSIKSFHMINRGGSHISDSISKSLDIPFTKAEEMKKEFGLFENLNERSLADTIRTHLDYIFSETNNVLLGYEKRYNRTISKVILTGGGSLLKGLREVAASNFKAEVETGHPFSKVVAPEFLQKVLEINGPEFAVALGLALRKLQ